MAKHCLFAKSSTFKRCLVFLLAPLLFFTPRVFADNFQACIDDQQSVNSVFQRIQNEWPLYGSGEEVTQYVQNLGIHLARLIGYGNAFPWRFYVVRNLAPNAVSIGGGYVFITEGAISFAQTESELVAILAHEIGHEVAGHFCLTQKNEPFDSFFDDLSTPSSQSHQVGIGSLTQVIDVVKEQQADHIALSIIKAGGYDPRAMLTLARRLPLDGSTHLIDLSRIQSLEQAIANLPIQPRQSSNEFFAIKHKLITR